MGRLSREQEKAHAKACALVKLKRDLTEPEREFVLHNFHEGAIVARSTGGVFFTPPELASNFQLECSGRRVIDLCAGTGRLAWACRDTGWARANNEPPTEFVCVEANPEFVEVGRKVMPEATWISADVLTVPSLGLGEFDCAISNPPYGRIKRNGNGPCYSGPLFEYHVAAVAATVARRGVFILPQTSAPFRYSDRPNLERQNPAELARFTAETGVVLRTNLGISTGPFRELWHDTAPVTEIVPFDLITQELERSQGADEPRPRLPRLVPPFAASTAPAAALRPPAPRRTAPARPASVPEDTPATLF